MLNVVEALTLLPSVLLHLILTVPLAFLLAVTTQVNPVVFCTVALDVSLDVQYIIRCW